jgi:peptidoglycan/xylan/chitin deacetylase (PgdA/CDA1 family)
VRSGPARWLARIAAAVRLPDRIRRRRHRRGDYRVFMLEYHAITAAERLSEGRVRVRTLERHLRHLAGSYAFVTVTDAVRRLLGPEPLAGDLMAFTFDDGYADNAELAWPTIRRQGATATFFLTTGFLDGEPLWFDVAERGLRTLSRSGGPPAEALAEALRRSLPGWRPTLSARRTVDLMKYVSARERERLVALMSDHALGAAGGERSMSWDQARAISLAGGEIGVHTVSHPILFRLDPAEQEREIFGSRDRVTTEMARRPTSFAYPNGSSRDFDATTREIVARAGFEAACTTIRGSNSPACDPLLLRRQGVGEDSLAALDARLAGLFDERVRRPLAALADPRAAT